MMPACLSASAEIQSALRRICTTMPPTLSGCLRSCERQAVGDDQKCEIEGVAMAVIISMLRAVNVGAHHRIKMDALRALYEPLELRDPQTYVQSGNVVFRTDKRDLVALAKRIEDAIERGFGFRPTVILRTSGELRDAIARNPFAKRSGIEPSRLLVYFLASDPGAEIRNKVLSLKTEPEELRM